MAKLFAMEELDNENLGVELEATPEEGEVADVQVEVEQGLTEAAGDESAIEEGVEAADQLEEVQDVVEQAAGNEGEGLDPVAAEAIRIAVEAIAARVGANPKSVFALYATENFQSSSSRKANTKIALEGVAEFLKDLWKKIKGALTKLWEKAKAFWDKHFSNLGRIKSALESAKQKVSESSGKLKDKAYIEQAPSALVEAFPGGDVSAKSIEAFVKAHKAAADQAGEVTKELSGLATRALESVKNQGGVSSIVEGLKEKTYEVGSKSAPLVGGVFTKYTVKAEDNAIAVETEQETVEKGEKGGVSLAEKGELAALVKSTLDLIVADTKEKAAADKAEAEFKKTMLAVETAINANTKDAGSAEAAKETRGALKIIYKAYAKLPAVFSGHIAQDIRLAKGVLGFAGLCMKNYK